MAATASTLLLLVIALIGFCKGEGAILDSTAPDHLTTAAKHLNFPGYRPPRACKLDGLEFATGAFVFESLVKHGVHAQSWLKNKGRCREDRLEFAGVLEAHEVDKFVGHRRKYKVLPVRGQLSYFKSLYNHVCNKMTPEKVAARANHGVNCSRRDEFARLQSIGFEEMNECYDPNRIRDRVVEAGPEHLLFYDYAALGDLTDPFCENSLNDTVGTIGINSGTAQGYEDYWEAQSVSTWRAGLSKFWDDMYVQLQRHKCLYFEKM